MKKTTIILSGIIFIYIIFFSLSAGQLYYGDEVVFLIASEEISTGKIVGHFSFTNGIINDNLSTMLVHPPTYIYLLSLFIKLFGNSSYVVRSVSALFSIGVIILIYLTTKKILKKRNIEKSENWALFAAFLYAINPLAIQSSIIIDIDGGLLNFFSLLFIYLYISKKSYLYLIPSLFMIFASKLSGAIILFGAIILLNLISLDYKEIFKTIKLFLISGGLFFLSFFIYTKIFNLNGKSLFLGSSIIDFIIIFIKNPYLILARSFWALKLFFYFATPFLFFLFIICIYLIIKNILKYKLDYIKTNKDLLLLWVYSIVVILFYLLTGVTGWNFPKYHIAILPSIIILIIYFTPKRIINIKKIIPLIIITLILLSGYFIFFLNDPLIPEVKGRVSTTSLIHVATLVVIRTLKYAIFPILLCFILFKKIPRKRLWLILLFLLIFTSFYLNLIQINADYSTHNIYGDKGLEEVLEFLKEIPPNQLLCYPHLSYYLGYNKTYELTSVYKNKTRLKEILNQVNRIVLFQKDIDSIGEHLTEFELEKQIYDYQILKRIVNQ
tara:strand:+ start:19540 stop:21198 length:1659 start_codon:yes stop_codon:yes gene_type:complete